MRESSAVLPETTQLLKRETGMPLSTAIAMAGPIPLTRSMSIRNTSRSSSVAKPYSVCAVSRMWRCVRKSTSSPSAARSLSKVEIGMITS